jgi:hypothetical protein
MKSLTESKHISTRELDFSKMPTSLASRQDQQGRVVQWLWDWRGRSTGVEEMPEPVIEIYERLSSIWEDLQNPAKISDSNVRKEHAEKFGISPGLAFRDYQDAFLYNSFESPEFKKGYKQRNLERYERMYNFAVSKSDTKLAVSILEKIDNLLQLSTVEDADKDIREKLKARIVPIIMTDASEKLIQKLTQDGGAIDLSNIGVEDINFEEIINESEQ